MASVYPGSLDSFPTSRADATVMAATHPADHNDANDAINKIEAELGTDPSATFATVKARLDDLRADLDVVQPAAPSAYAVTGATTDRTINVGVTTMDEGHNVLATLIADLQARGIVGV